MTSELAAGELWSALLSKERGKMLSAGNRNQAWRAFLNDIDEGSFA